jgi:hypothetical protein
VVGGCTATSPGCPALNGSEVVVDLLSGACTCDGVELLPSLALVDDVLQWIGERLVRDGVPQGTVAAATLTLCPRIDERQRLTVECSTTLTTSLGTYESHDTARWHPGDVRDVRDA